MAGTSFDDALALHQSGRIAAAEAIYRLVLQQQPDHPGALHLLGVIRQQQGDFAAALELIGRAISVNPRKAVYHNNYGAAFQSLGRMKRRRSAFNEPWPSRQSTPTPCPTWAWPVPRWARTRRQWPAFARHWLCSRDTPTRCGNWPPWFSTWASATRRFASTRKH